MADFYVKECYGRIWHFYNNKNGIFYCIMTSDTVTNYDMLTDNVNGSFDVAIDDNDNIHLVYQNKSGDIIYANCYKKQWTFETVLKSKTPSLYDKCPKLLRVNNWLNVIYTIEYKGNKLLTHQIINALDIEPTAIDVIEEEFSVASDSRGNIYVFYFSLGEKSFGIRKYLWSKKEWCDFNKVNAPSDFTDFCLFIDSNENIHIAGKSGNKAVVVNEETEILGNGSSPIFIEKDVLYILWENEGKVVSAISSDGGETFKYNGETMSGRFQRVKKYGLRCTGFEKGYKTNEAYGYVNEENKVFLHFLKEFFVILKAPPKPVNKSINIEAKKYSHELKKEKMAEFDVILEMDEKLDKIIQRLEYIKTLLTD